MTENFSDFMKQLISHFYCNVCIMSTAAVYGNLLKHYNIIVAVCISLGFVTFAGYASCIKYQFVRM